MTYEWIGRVRTRAPRRAPAPPPAEEAEATPSQPHLPLLPPRPRVHPPLVPLLLLRRGPHPPTHQLTNPSSRSRSSALYPPASSPPTPASSAISHSPPPRPVLAEADCLHFRALSLRLPLSLSLPPSRSPCLPSFLPLSLSHTHTHTHTFSLFLTPSVPPTPPPSAPRRPSSSQLFLTMLRLGMGRTALPVAELLVTVRRNDVGTPPPRPHRQLRAQARQNSSYLELRKFLNKFATMCLYEGLIIVGFFFRLERHPLRLVKQHHQRLETAHIRDQYSSLLITVLNRHLRYRGAVPLLTMLISLLECCTRSVLGWTLWTGKKPRGIKCRGIGWIWNERWPRSRFEE